MNKREQERLERLKEQKRQMEERIKKLEQKKKEQERRERTKRLIEKGAIVEQYLGNISKDELVTIMERLQQARTKRSDSKCF